MKKTIISIALVSVSLMASAQSLDETFNVEGIEMPKLEKQERIAQLPSALNLKLSNPGLQYSATGVTVPVSPYLTPLPAAGWKDSYNFDKGCGYLDFGLGSYLDATLSAGVRFVDNGQSMVGLRLQHNSSTAFNPFKDAEGDKPGARKIFDEYIGLYGSHIFEGIGRIDASLNYRLGYFNYYGLLIDNSRYNQPSQTTNSFDGAVRFTSPNNKSLQWNAGLEYNHFGYRRMYMDDGAELKGLKQNLIAINGGVNYMLGSDKVLLQKVGLDIDADFIIFSHSDISEFENTAMLYQPDNYSHFRLKPYYNVIAGKFSGKVGANIDFMANAGPATDRYRTFNASPDIYIGYRHGKFGIGLQATGGVELNTLQRNAALDRYATPWLTTTTPIYSPFDGRLSVDLGSFYGVSAQLAFAYKVIDNQPLEGYYMQYLSGMPQSIGTFNISGYSLQAGLRYRYAKILEATADLSYQPQRGDKGYFNGLDRPRWLLDAKLGLTPLKGLRIDLQYQYRGVRTLYGLEGEELTGMRLPDVTDLSVGASYAVLPEMLTLWVRADNLLGTDAYLNPMLPTPGVAIMGGVQLRF